MRMWIAVALLAAPAAAKAQAASADFCAELWPIVAAAAETPPFASLPGRWSEGARPMFGFGIRCGVHEDERGRRFLCAEPLPPAAVTLAGLAAQTARCLPRAIRGPDEQRGGRFAVYSTSFRLGNVLINISDGGHRTRRGRAASYVVSVADGGREDRNPLTPPA